MAVDRWASLGRKIVSTPTKTESEVPVTITRPGTVVAVNTDGTVDVSNIGGSANVIENVPTSANYIGKTGDEVAVEFSDYSTRVAEKTTGTSPTVFRGFESAALVATATARAAITYGDLPSDLGPSLSVTVGDSGILLVSISCLISATSDNDGGAVSFALSGANTLAADDARRISFIGNVVNSAAEFGKVIPVTGLTPGATTVTMKYKDLLDTGNDVLYGNRELWAMPL